MLTYGSVIQNDHFGTDRTLEPDQAMTDPAPDPVRSTAQKRDDKGDVRNGAEWLAIWSDPESLKTNAEKRNERSASKVHNSVSESIAAALRSLSSKPDLDVRFGQSESESAHHIVLPELDRDLSNLSAVRGVGDAKASLVRYHDPDLKSALTFDDPDSARLYMSLEQCRCTALLAQNAPGITLNLVAAQTDRLQRASLFEAHLASLIPLAEAILMVARDSFHNAPDPSLQTAGFRMWDQWLRARYQSDFDAMAACLESQSAFAAQACAFLQKLLTEISAAPQRPKQLVPSSSDETGEVNKDQLRETDDVTDAIVFEPGDAIFLDDDTPLAPAPPIAPPAPYRPYTTAYDRVVHASDLPGLGDLRDTRRKLDEKQAAFRQEMTRLVAKLQRRLMAQRLSRWDFDLEEGMIDAARLDRVVVNPGFQNAYKQEMQAAFSDTCVTLLIDNSGSMRGKQIETACVVADILSAALEKCGVATEILGFTTSAWKGGKSAKDWARSGKPENPGRLNDLQHIIYKDADTSLRRARDAICAMLTPSVLKENIDGEALLWAEHRLVSRPETRKLLIVLSDGAPVDQATVENNADADLLDRHLRQITARIQTATPIELSAIGIKHDVSPYYRNSTRVDDITGLGQALIDLLDAQLT